MALSELDKVISDYNESKDKIIEEILVNRISFNIEINTDVLIVENVVNGLLKYFLSDSPTILKCSQNTIVLLVFL